MFQCFVGPAAIEVQVGAVFLDAKGIILSHVFLVDGNVVFQITAVRLAQTVEVFTDLCLQLVVFLVLGKGFVEAFFDVATRSQVEEGEDVAVHHHDQLNE